MSKLFSAEAKPKCICCFLLALNEHFLLDILLIMGLTFALFAKDLINKYQQKPVRCRFKRQLSGSITKGNI